MKSRNIIESFNYAVLGIINALKTERNMRIHFFIATIVIVLSLFLDFSRIELLMLFVAIAFVFITEMINTAIERTVDLITEEYHPLARVVKDIAAGGVLIAAINSLVVGYLLFFDRLNPLTNLVLYKIKNSPIHLTFIALVLVIILTITFKTIYHKGKGTPFQGGTVSGHAAISFCIATIIAFIAQNMLISTLSFILAILVGESRVEGKIHSIMEVVLGGLLGILVGILVFQIIG
ncbi:diacylglycerol kinase [Tepidimicrobium xylanilyticum]|uniref:Diacylglycerol kinase (ATP) n=1 Tax=Tepidimicrobium xylanilyticum TaxID=1123352 RepID=A0A1H2T214_9FIRM|nr:diacylglycerol kinase [Tepidimicrobium xylanilyticum]GMG96046.1 diacylglycerol kinase [Tepidimicrobium xylanilyticum]SDW37870.1 diacylglycerol kinase (ATP) [Tepidimicrobium xylanilyticum]